MKYAKQFLENELEEMKEEFPYFFKKRNNEEFGFLEEKILKEKINEIKEFKMLINLLDEKFESIECNKIFDVRLKVRNKLNS